MCAPGPTRIKRQRDLLYSCCAPSPVVFLFCPLSRLAVLELWGPLPVAVYFPPPHPCHRIAASLRDGELEWSPVYKHGLPRRLSQRTSAALARLVGFLNCTEPTQRRRAPGRYRHGINSIGVTLASKLACRRLPTSKMGNAPSVVEGPEKGRRTAQKLTKPRTTNVATAGLLDPNHPPNPRRRFSAARTWSLPYGTEPAPSPLYPSSDAGTTDQWDDNHDSERIGRSRSVKNIFRSRSSQGRSRNGDSSQDGHLATPAPSTRPSRANSMIVGTADHPYYGLGVRPGYVPHATTCFISFADTTFSQLVNCHAQHAFELRHQPVRCQPAFELDGGADLLRGAVK